MANNANAEQPNEFDELIRELELLEIELEKAHQPEPRVEPAKPSQTFGERTPPTEDGSESVEEDQQDQGLQILTSRRGPGQSATPGRQREGRSKLAHWKRELTRAGERFSSGEDLLLIEGNRVRGRTGSAGEVQGMFELAGEKGWNHLVFNGDDKFKMEVMREALKRGLEVQPQGRNDAELLTKVQQKPNESTAKSTPGQQRLVAEGINKAKRKADQIFEESKMNGASLNRSSSEGVKSQEKENRKGPGLTKDRASVVKRK